MFIPLSRFANRNLIDELYSTTQPDKQSSYLIMISSHLNLHYFCHLIFVQFPSYRCFYVKFPQADNRYYIFLISVSKPFMCNENKCRKVLCSQALSNYTYSTLQTPSSWKPHSFLLETIHFQR